MFDRLSPGLKPDSQGFTLIEVLIALAIAAMGFLAVASLQISANLGSRKACEVTQASTIASDQMEKLMALPFDDGDLDPTTNPHPDPHPGSVGKYAIEWIVTDSDLNADGECDAKVIELSVKWKKILSKGKQRDLKLTFIRHDL